MLKFANVFKFAAAKSSLLDFGFLDNSKAC